MWGTLLLFLTLFPRRDMFPHDALRIVAAIRPALPGEWSARVEVRRACSPDRSARPVAAQSLCVELRVHRDLVQSSPASAAAEHIQPSLDITPWGTRSAQRASNSHQYDKR